MEVKVRLRVVGQTQIWLLGETLYNTHTQITSSARGNLDSYVYFQISSTSRSHYHVCIIKTYSESTKYWCVKIPCNPRSAYKGGLSLSYQCHACHPHTMNIITEFMSVLDPLI